MNEAEDKPKPEQETTKEVRWIESESLQNVRDCDYNVPECFDLFADPDPIEVFSFQWRIPEVSSVTPEPVSHNFLLSSKHGTRSGVDFDDDSCGDSLITIELTGYKAELGQTLHSTGLTLWRASGFLCDFMIDEYKSYIVNKKVLEVSVL